MNAPFLRCTRVGYFSSVACTSIRTLTFRRSPNSSSCFQLADVVSLMTGPRFRVQNFVWSRLVNQPRLGCSCRSPSPGSPLIASGRFAISEQLYSML